MATSGNVELHLNEIKIVSPDDTKYKYTTSGLPEVFGNGVITVCGASRFDNFIEYAAIILKNEGWAVFTPSPIIYDDEEGIEKYHDAFNKQILRSEAVLCVDTNQAEIFHNGGKMKTYIGEDTLRELLLADVSDVPIFKLSDHYQRFNTYCNILRQKFK